MSRISSKADASQHAEKIEGSESERLTSKDGNAQEAKAEGAEASPTKAPQPSIEQLPAVGDFVYWDGNTFTITPQDDHSWQDCYEMDSWHVEQILHPATRPSSEEQSAAAAEETYIRADEEQKAAAAAGPTRME